MPTQHLPSHRHVFTTLVNALLPPALSVSNINVGDTAGLSLSGSASTQRHHLLLTLHVLFPNLLLPALDLLDRRLIARIVVPCTAEEPGQENEPATGDRVAAAMEHSARSDSASRTYIVRSAVSPSARRRREPTRSSTKSYAVHLDAWSCSCASFALDAFPSHFKYALENEYKQSPQLNSFGGLSQDGLAGTQEHVPCCKHLLACFLTDKCSIVLGSCIEHRVVSKETLAAMLAGL